MLDRVLRQDDRIPTATEDGLRRIGSGNNRIVFRVVDDRYEHADEGDVVKRAYPYADENQREIAVWDAVEGSDAASYFVPVLAHASDGFWLVMPFAAGGNVSAERVRVVRERFGGQDVGAGDFGRYGGTMRCYDYGSCAPPSSW